MNRATPAEAAEHSAAPTVITPPAGLMLPDLVEIWQQRHVLFALIWRNVARRYRQTVLGPFWFVLRPLMRMVLFSVVLGSVAGLPSEGVPYPIFTYTALLPWELFANGAKRGTNCFVSYHHIISKAYFPRLLVPAAEVVTALVDFALSFLILILLMAFYRIPPTWGCLMLPVFLGVAMALSLSFGLLLASLQARFRDVSDLVGYLLQFWMYGTPVAYSATVLVDRVPESVLFFYRLNPMFGVVEGFRWALLGIGEPPGWQFLVSTGLTLLALFIASTVFLRSEHSIVDRV